MGLLKKKNNLLGSMDKAHKTAREEKKRKKERQGREKKNNENTQTDTEKGSLGIQGWMHVPFGM